MNRKVYIGAAEYAAGKPIPIEYEVLAANTFDRLRHSTHGAFQFPRHDSDILELAEVAIKKSIETSQVDPTTLGAVFLVSNMLDARDNLDTAWLGDLYKRLNLSDIAHYHVGIAGCGGFHWALRLAASMIAADQCDNALIVCFDKVNGSLKRVYGEDSPFLYLTGDAAASCIVSSSSLRMDYLLTGKVINLQDGTQILNPSMDAELRIISKLFEKTYDDSGVTANDINFFITNNYSFDISKLYCQLANVRFSKAFTETISTHAHCFSSDNIINLHYLTKKAELLDGHRVLLFSTGPAQWGACVFEKVSASVEAQH